MNEVKTYLNIGGAIVDADNVTIPDDRSFREAWSLSGAKVVVDMVAARDIHRENLRAARAPLFNKNDIAIRDAQIENDAAALAAAIARRNTLRNVTADPRIEAAGTPEDLLALTIDVLLNT